MLKQVLASLRVISLHLRYKFTLQLVTGLSILCQQCCFGENMNNVHVFNIELSIYIVLISATTVILKWCIFRGWRKIKIIIFIIIITKTYWFNSTNDSLDGSISKVKTGLAFFSVDKYVTRVNKKSNLEIFLKKYTKCLF